MRADFRLKPESEEMLTLDAIRFVAATGIVVLHYWGEWCFHEKIAGAHRLDFLSLFVDVFFVISGFVISSVYSERVGSMRGYLSFMQKRLARLAPLHWATLLFFCIFGGLLLLSGRPNHFPQAYDWSCVVPHAAFLHAFGTCPYPAFNMASWSISAEMALYVIFPVFLLLARRRPAMLAGISLATLGVMYVLSGGPNGDELHGWTNWTVTFGAVRGLAGFSLGMALYAYRNPLSRIPFAAPFLLASFVAFLGFGLAGVPPMWVAPFAYAIAVFGVLTDLSGGPGKAVRGLSSLGQLTYSVYLLHIPVHLLALAIVGEHLLHLHGVAYAGWTIISAFLVFPVAWLSLILFERPARKWVGQLGHPASAPVLAMAPAGPEELAAEPSPGL